jgi:hypothetical protein
LRARGPSGRAAAALALVWLAAAAPRAFAAPPAGARGVGAAAERAPASAGAATRPRTSAGTTAGAGAASGVAPSGEVSGVVAAPGWLATAAPATGAGATAVPAGGAGGAHEASGSGGGGERAGPAAGATASKAESDAYARHLVAEARRRGLATSEAWRRLGHWRPGLFGGRHSEADGADFFLAPGGKDDPGAELEATVRGFFLPEASFPGRTQHPLCRFPARFAWLSRELGLDARRLPAVGCARFEEFWGRLQARSATVVFSSYYLNNPASAFGHTFLRLNKGAPGAAGRRPELLDYGVDYSATVDTGNALVYAFKGLTGLFPGLFNVYPYYYKVREYNDYESRDLWEYDLDLAPGQLAMLVAHLWELGSTYFDYYYLSENCSYHVLGALEVADPGLRLLDKVGTPVIPVDTVKALFENEGLVRGVRFRPSLRTQFRRRVAGLSGPERDAVEALARDPAAPLPRDLPPARRVRVLDAAADLVDVRYAKEVRPERDGPGARLKQRLLERRAEIAVPSEELAFAPPAGDRPERGHDSARVGPGFGYSGRGGSFFALDARLALHDLADPPRGYPDTAQIEFLPTRLRFWPEGRSPQVEDVSFVQVVSLTPVDRFDLQPSWKVRAGATRARDAGCRGCFAGLLGGGAGFAAGALGGRLLLFATADLELLGSASLAGPGGLPLRAGVGPAGGARLRLGDDLALVTSGRWLWLPAQAPRATWEAQATLRWAYARNGALSLEARHQPLALEGQLLSYVYF